MNRLLHIIKDEETIKHAISSISSIDNESASNSIKKETDRIKKKFSDSDVVIFDEGTPEYHEYFDPKPVDPNIKTPLQLKQEEWLELNSVEQKVEFLAKQLKLIE